MERSTAAGALEIVLILHGLLKIDVGHQVVALLAFDRSVGVQHFAVNQKVEHGDHLVLVACHHASEVPGPQRRVREDGRQVAVDLLGDRAKAWVLKRNGFGFLKVHASPSLRRSRIPQFHFPRSAPSKQEQDDPI